MSKPTPRKVTTLAQHRAKRQRVNLWCELLKAILEDRPVTLLERAPHPKKTHTTPLQLPLFGS